MEKRSFREWKKTGCLLWIQGKRTFLCSLCKLCLRSC
jgi:hypothetical protein